MKKYFFLCYIFWGMYEVVAAQSNLNETTILQRHRELSSNRLSNEQIQAYTKRAKQKLGDVVDYVTIILNTEQVLEQAQALKLLQNLFVNTPHWAKSVHSLKDFVGNKRNLDLKSVEIVNPLVFFNSNEYRGTLSYEWLSRKDLIVFVVRKNIKKIGSREVEVWELFFSF